VWSMRNVTLAGRLPLHFDPYASTNSVAESVLPYFVMPLLVGRVAMPPRPGRSGSGLGMFYIRLCGQVQPLDVALSNSVRHSHAIAVPRSHRLLLDCLLGMLMAADVGPMP
jgi:hypothetical protein